MRASWILGSALVCAIAAHAVGWLDSPAAAQFRDRVVLLALSYGESSGIDPQGYMVRTKELRKLEGDCSEVEAVTLRGGEEVRRETVHACRHPKQ